MTASTNTQHLGLNYRGKSWDDGKPISSVDLGDGTVAEVTSAVAYVWNGASFDKVPGDAVNGMKVQVTQPIPAGTNLLGQVAASPETGTIYSGTTALTPSFANLTASSSGATTLVALVANKRIRVTALSLMANGTVNVKFQSHVSPTDISGLYYLIANTGFVLPFNPAGWFQTVSGEALDINLSGAIAVGGSITYVAV